MYYQKLAEMWENHQNTFLHPKDGLGSIRHIGNKMAAIVHNRNILSI
jgi:hypothetical protein